MAENRDHLFQLEILTPDKTAFSGEVTYVRAPGAEGYFGVLANHAPLLAALRIGELIVDTPEGRRFFAVSGGFLEVLKNHVRVLVETAEEASEIDVERAKQALLRAKNRLATHSPDIDVDRARSSMYRALNRLKVASQK